MILCLVHIRHSINHSFFYLRGLPKISIVSGLEFDNLLLCKILKIVSIQAGDLSYFLGCELF